MDLATGLAASLLAGVGLGGLALWQILGDQRRRAVAEEGDIRGVMAEVGAAAVGSMGLVGAVLLGALLIRGDGQNTGNASQVVTAEAPSASTAPVTSIDPSCDGLCVEITEVGVADDGELTISWTPINFAAPPASDSFHAHVFYDNFEPGQVGSNFRELGYDQQGSWQQADVSPFLTRGTSVEIATAPPEAERICMVTANPDHGVVNPENAACAVIPDR